MILDLFYFSRFFKSYMSRWFYSVSHKDIGIFFLSFALFAGLVGYILPMFVRLELGFAVARALVVVLISNADFLDINLLYMNFLGMNIFGLSLLGGDYSNDNSHYKYGYNLYSSFLSFNPLRSITTSTFTSRYHKPYNVLPYNPLLGSYLAGLIEGDSASADIHPHMLASGGRIYTPKPNNVSQMCYIKITFEKRDKDWVEYLRSKLGGSILYEDNKINISFSAQNEVAFIANLINGNMRTPKIEALGRLINFMHQNHPNIHVESF